MKLGIVINAALINEYALKPFKDGKNSFEIVLEESKKLADCTNILILQNDLSDFQSDCKTVKMDSWTMNDVLSELLLFSKEKPEIDTLLYCYADAPFLDISLAKELLDVHKRYRSEYTFADGYAIGFAPEIICTRILSSLENLIQQYKIPLDRDSIFSLIQKDINSFDIETILSPVDLRPYRFNPVCDSLKNFLSAKKLLEFGEMSAIKSTQIIPEHPELMRTVPAFMWVQINETCQGSCFYCPYPKMKKENRIMSVEQFDNIMSQAEKLSHELVVDISLWGECSLHPEIESIVDSVMSRPGFSLIIETSGISWKDKIAQKLSVRYQDRLSWIVSLDAIDPDNYKAIRGDGFLEATTFVNKLLECTKENVYIQCVRMKENEETIEAFYRYWKRNEAKTIIQKYDSFAGSLDCREVADLSPLKRIPCRHLARDISVLINGDVPICKHGLTTKDNELVYQTIVGNVFRDGLQKIWDNMNEYYVNHCSKDYPQMCRKCNEFHTFNA